MLNAKEWSQQSFHTLPEPYSWLIPGHAFKMNSENSDWTTPDQEITKILVEEFKQVPEVKSICAQFGQEEITIWTLLESYDRDARGKVYEKELKLCKILSVYDFDFRVTSIELVSPDDLVRAGSHILYRRK
ncbi:MAG: hypothetical protein ACREDT_13130 [Methylocella sp.]